MGISLVYRRLRLGGRHSASARRRKKQLAGTNHGKAQDSSISSRSDHLEGVHLSPSAAGYGEQRPRQHMLLWLLAFIAGFVDTAGFVVLFGLFTAHVTGNVVLAAVDAMHEGGAGTVTELLMIPIFVCAVVLSTLAMDFARTRWRKRTLSLMIALEALLLGGFFAAALLLKPHQSSPDAWPVLVVGGLGVLAMGVQNTMARELPLVSRLPTTMMTGNLTQTTIAAVHWVRAGRIRDDAMRAKSVEQLQLFLPTFLTFLLGAAAAGVVIVGYWSFAIPMVVAAAVATLAFSMLLDLAPPQ